MSTFSCLGQRTAVVASGHAVLCREGAAQLVDLLVDIGQQLLLLLET